LPLIKNALSRDVKIIAVDQGYGRHHFVSSDYTMQICDDIVNILELPACYLISAFNRI